MQQTKELLAQFDPTSQRPREPDYIFVASSKRCKVLLDQLECLELDDYRIYKDTNDPEERVIILVFFYDKILNRKAEDMGLQIQVQDKF